MRIIEGKIGAIADAVSELDVVTDNDDAEITRVAAFNLARAVADFCLPHLSQRVDIYAILQRFEEER